MKRTFYLVLALVIVILIAYIISKGFMPDGDAVATRVEGTVRIFTRDSPTGRLLKNKDRIAKNDRLEVLGNSRLELSLPDGSHLRLSENTRLAMQTVKFKKQTGTLQLRAVLQNGRLWMNIKKRAAPAPDSWVEVTTSTGLITAKDPVYGSAYSVEAVEDASTTLNVYEGVVPTVTAAGTLPQIAALTNTLSGVHPDRVQTVQQVTVSAQHGVSPVRNVDPKASINDWVRWNLQRDARQGLVSITIAPTSSTVIRGSSMQFSAVAHYPDNTTNKDITWFATWRSSDATVAKIDPSGVAAGTEPGSATISAAIEDMSGSTVLNVRRDLLSIAVTPASRSVINGSVQQFTAMGTFTDKTVMNITSSAVWTSSNTSVASVDAVGKTVAGNMAGTAVISASLGAKRGSATLKVRRELVSITIIPKNATIQPGEKQLFEAKGNYSDKTTEDLTDAVAWDTSDMSIALIDQAQAGRVVVNHKAGSATINASFNGKMGSATITVTP